MIFGLFKIVGRPNPKRKSRSGPHHYHHFGHDWPHTSMWNPWNWIVVVDDADWSVDVRSGAVPPPRRRRRRRRRYDCVDTVVGWYWHSGDPESDDSDDDYDLVERIGMAHVPMIADVTKGMIRVVEGVAVVVVVVADYLGWGPSDDHYFGFDSGDE